jgi:hypothetical protein
MRAFSRSLGGFFLLSVIVSVGCGMAQNMGLAKSAIAEFHTRFNAGQFDAIYDAADPAWQKAMDRDTSNKFFARVQRKMGGCSSSKDTTYFYNVTANGTFVNMHYQTTCAAGTLEEDFRCRVVGEKVMIIAYNAANPLLLTD